MPYPNEHSCRLHNPDDYDSFNRGNCGQKHDGKCIDVIYGIKDKKSEIQALRYKTDIWTEEDAKEHCASRDGMFEPAAEEEKSMQYECECLDCGYTFESNEHCGDIECPECGGKCRRKERPGPGQKSSNKEVERRTFELDNIEVRAGDGEEKKISGHAAVFNKLSEDLGGFREIIDSGAFSASIKKDDVRALFNHDMNLILGRNKAGTLTLKEDNEGLYYEVTPPDTSYARDLMVSIERGDVTQCSFAFNITGKNGEYWKVDGEKVPVNEAFNAMFSDKQKEVVRHVVTAKLYDVSPVTYPAYPQTDVKVRALIGDDALEVIEKARRGVDLSEEDRELIEGTITKLRGYIPEPELVSEGAPENEGYVHWLEKIRRQLELSEIS